MNIAYAYDNIPKVECTNAQLGLWRVRWGFKSAEGEDNKNAVSFMEYQFTHKPSMGEVKAKILDWYNQTIDERIISGFSWNGYPVWLSTENQFNYKAAYDLAVQTNGDTLPVTFKFGTTDAPVYYTFSSLSELTKFYMAATQFVTATLTAGWKEKDAIDWQEYEMLLDNDN